MRLSRCSRSTLEALETLVRCTYKFWNSINNLSERSRVMTKGRLPPESCHATFPGASPKKYLVVSQDWHAETRDLARPGDLWETIIGTARFPSIARQRWHDLPRPSLPTALPTDWRISAEMPLYSAEYASHPRTGNQVIKSQVVNPIGEHSR